MPNKDANELRALDDQQLNDQLQQAHRELFNLRFRNATRQLTNNQEIGRVKRRIARLKTLQTERRLGIRH